MQTIAQHAAALRTKMRVQLEDEQPIEIAADLEPYQLPDKQIHRFTEAELTGAIKNCEYCDGIGYIKLNVPIRDHRFGKMLTCPACKRYNQELHNRRVIENMSGLLERYTMLKGDLLDKTFKNYQREHAPTTWQAAYDWAGEVWRGESNKPWLYIYGAPGNGKTHLAAAAANALTMTNIATVFSTFTELCGMAAANRFEEKEDVIRALQKVPVLIIDDILDEELDTKWKLALLFRILDSRYATRFPTMIISNMPPFAIGGITSINDFEPRIASRLLDHQMCRVVLNDGEDHRRRNS